MCSLCDMPDRVGTILYEIDMLDYCFARLRAPWKATREDYNLWLEGFLLHYRNLIKFFASHKGLKAQEPQEWSPRALSAAEIASIQNQAIQEHYRPISRYLSHCDRIRGEEGTHWNSVEMYNEIEPTLKSFRRLFPSAPRPAAAILGAEDASTTALTILSPSILLDSELIGLGLREPSDIADKARQQRDDSNEK